MSKQVGLQVEPAKHLVHMRKGIRCLHSTYIAVTL